MTDDAPAELSATPIVSKHHRLPMGKVAVGILTLATILLVVSYELPRRVGEEVGSATASAMITGGSDHQWQEVYDLAYTGTPIKPTHCSYSPAAEQVVFLDVGAQLLVRFQPQYKRFEQIALPAGVITTAVIYKNQQVLVYANGLWQYDESPGQWQQVTSTLELPMAVTGLEYFGDNYYVYGQGLLRRLDFSNAGQYLGMSSWLEEADEITFNPVSLFLDGYLYVSQPEQPVYRFVRGEKTSWKLDLDSPPMGRVLLTGGRDDQLGFVTPDQESLIVSEADGTIITELIDPLLAGATCVYYDSQADAYAVLVGSKLYTLTPLNFFNVLE